MIEKVEGLVEWGAKKLWEDKYEPNYSYRHGWGVADPMIRNICREKARKYLSYFSSYPDLALIDRDETEGRCAVEAARHYKLLGLLAQDVVVQAGKPESKSL